MLDVAMSYSRLYDFYKTFLVVLGVGRTPQFTSIVGEFRGP